jgi:ribosomal protein S18 acetylase RimI-like enzyme
MPSELEIIRCDFDELTHREAVVNLINEYMMDTMGCGYALTPGQELSLVEELSKHPSCLVLLAVYNGEICGLLVSYINFSTFTARKFINIHDIIVLKEFRSMGIGRALINELTDIATEIDCCKITLEVRQDNEAAMHLYSDLGFEDSDPPMYFWTKTL